MTVTGAQIVTEVEKFLHYPYVYGGAGPNAFDCSGLVQYVLTSVGIQNVPRTSEQQWAWVNRIPANQLQPGNLVFAQFPGDSTSPGHVGIYTGNGQVLSAEDPTVGVGYSTLSSWGPNIVGYGQVPTVSTTAPTTATLTSFNPLSILPGNLGSVLGSLIGKVFGATVGSAFTGDITDVLERGALMLFGAVLIVVGLLRLTSNSETKISVVNPSGNAGNLRFRSPSSESGAVGAIEGAGGVAAV